MLKKFIVFGLIIGLALPAYAGMTINRTKLRVSNSVVEDLSLTNGVKVTSDSIRVRGNVGFATLIVTEDKTGGAGDVDIFAEYSSDNSNWYQSYTTSSGTLTVDSNIVTGLQNASRWIVFTPRLAPYVRFTFDPDADSQVTAELIYQEED